MLDSVTLNYSYMCFLVPIKDTDYTKTLCYSMHSSHNNALQNGLAYPTILISTQLCLRFNKVANWMAGGQGNPLGYRESNLSISMYPLLGTDHYFISAFISS